MRVVPLELAEANAVVAAWHRHHKPVVGHRFSLGVIDDDGVVRGAVIVGRPPNQFAGNRRQMVEVTRLVTDGTPNACSMLYGAAARVARHLGYTHIQTYVLASESGVSLKASGWVHEGRASPPSWHSRPGRRTDTTGRKERWGLELNTPYNPDLTFPSVDADFSQPTLPL